MGHHSYEKHVQIQTKNTLHMLTKLIKLDLQLLWNNIGVVL